jgi:signal transduction histidine kinase
MTADIAHDLRTPLTVIAGYLEALRDGTLKPTPERFRVMNEEVNLLRRLVEDLRTLSLADAGELKLMRAAVPPHDLLERIAASFREAAAAAAVSLRVDAADNVPDLWVDGERMAQVLGNLVTNALRYTPAGGSVALRAQASAGGVLLMVSDTGSGIAPDELPKIFDRFYRGDRARRANSGESGLGLAIAKSIVEAHGGTIAVQSALGSGTTMLLALPSRGA